LVLATPIKKKREDSRKKDREQVGIGRESRLTKAGINPRMAFDRTERRENKMKEERIGSAAEIKGRKETNSAKEEKKGKTARDAKNRDAGEAETHTSSSY